MSCEPANLTLIGAVHGDPDGHRRALRLFLQLRPDLLLVEISPFALSFRIEHQRELKESLKHNLRDAAARLDLPLRAAMRHPRILAVRKQIGLPFEYRAASAFAKAHNAKVIPVDLSSFSHGWIETWPELLATENLEALLTLPVTRRTSVAATYWAAARYIHGTASGDVRVQGAIGRSGELDEQWKAREYYMADQVRRALQEHCPQRPVYIGGWWHLTSGDSYSTIRDILKIPAARCRLLLEYGERESKAEIMA